MNEPTNQNDELCRISAKLAVIEQKCDLILAQLSNLKTNERLDELINRLQSCARSMREGNAVEE